MTRRPKKMWKVDERPKTCFTCESLTVSNYGAPSIDIYCGNSESKFFNRNMTDVHNTCCAKHTHRTE